MKPNSFIRQLSTRRNTLIEGTARLANATVAKFTANFPKNFRKLDVKTSPMYLR